MRIGILYICTGKYDVFWKAFYESAEKYLCPEAEKHYFVFTDSEQIISEGRVHKIYQERLGWPKDTLMRFHLFLDIKDQLKEMDYLFFFNANYTFTKIITTADLLPTENDNYLVGQIHPVAYHKKRKNFDYETNAQSTAYIPPATGKYYFAGGLLGGRAPEFLLMCFTLKNNIDKDLSKDIIAKWHDESYINQFFSVVEPKKLNPGFCYPEDWFLPFKKENIIAR